MKRILSFVLAFILFIYPFVDIANAEDKPDYEPELVITSTEIPTALAGEDLTLAFKIKNAGVVPVRNVTVTPEFLGDANPFLVGGFDQSYNIEGLNSTPKEVKMKFGVSNSAVEGTYPVKLNFNYKYSNNSNGEFSKTINIRVVNNNKTAQLFVTDASTTPDILSAGSSAKLNINFKNQGNIVAKDVIVTLEGLNSNEGFYIEKGSDKQSIDRINGNSSSYVNYNIKASRGISPGGHELVVKFKYKSGTESIEDSQKIYLNIGAKDGKNSNINIENISFPNGPISPGGNYRIRFNLRNKGLLNAKNIIVKVESGDGAIVPTSQSVVKIDRLGTGKGQVMNFAFTPTPDAVTRNYPINIIVEYEDEGNKNSENKYVVNQYAGIYAYNPPKKEAKPTTPKEPAPQHKPKLIIDKYSFEPQLVQAGENFTMKLSFYNTNATKAVKNIKIFLTSDEKTEEDTGGGGNSVFTPVETSNTFYIENIPPKGRVEKSIKMFTVPDAKAKTYTIVANFEYEDGQAKEYTATELIGVPVVQKSRLDIGQINLPDEFYQGEPGSVNMEFYNTGKVTLYNLMVRLEGNFSKENASLFVGNFEPGASETFDGTIIPTDLGPIEGELVFTYEDSTGQVIENRQPFSSTVVEGMMMDEGMGEEMPEEAKTPIWKKLLIGAGAILLAFGGFKFYKKKKSDKEIADLEDWDEDSSDDKGLDDDEY